VESPERLAAYLANELDDAARAAVDAELARDPALRVRLDAIRRADRALASVRGPRPPAGFDERLEAAIDAELERLLGGDTAAEPETSDAPAQPRASNRREPWGARLGSWGGRRRAGWLPALAGAAAGLIAVAGIGIVVSDRFPGTTDGDDEVAVDMALDAADAPSSSLALPEAAERAAGAGPVVIDSGRVLTDDDVEALIDQPELVTLADERLDPVGGAQRADDHRAVLADDERVTHCLDIVLDTDPPPIPVLVELATDDDGTPVVAFGLVTLDPSTDAYTRRELWLLEHDDCLVRAFHQR
jgi:hypothetical protein